MLKRIKKPEGIKIEYKQHKKKIKEVNFIFDASFYYDCEIRKLHLDTNPYGDPALTEITQLTEGNDNGKLNIHIETFDNNEMLLEGDCDLDFVILNNILSAYHGLMDVYGDYSDDFSMIFECGVFKQLSIVKWNGNNIKDSILLYRSDSGTFLIKQSPWERILIRKLDILEPELVVYTNQGHIHYIMNMPPVIIRILTSLSKFILS
ncbi:hypothetical protein E1630_23660 [Salmonella enterica subsp. enterica serovar Baguida]|nr:hypothetical protein [Salmonella enterica subsp. enterica serovar Baguida]EGX8054096.1 hypothetical protein [Salmonella enterica subsp. enterica serovar Inganda]